MTLADYLERTGCSQSEFARKIGVSQGMVWQWLHGLRPISAESAKRIELATIDPATGEPALTRHDLRPDLFDPAVAR